MANEAMSEERLRKIQDEIEYARHVQESGNLSHIGEKLLSVASELLSALREAQEQYRELSLSYIAAIGQAQENAERAEKAEERYKADCEMMACNLRAVIKRAEQAEEAGYSRGVQAATVIVESRHQSSCNDRVTGACWEMLEQIRALIPPDTQEKED